MSRATYAVTEARDPSSPRLFSLSTRRLVPVIAAALWVGPAAWAAALDVRPLQVLLDDPQSCQQLLVSAAADGGRTVDVTRSARYESADPAVALIDERGLVRPVQDGTTRLIVTHGDQRCEVPVTVAGVERPQPILFARDIVPILSKAGCNSGGCHGKAEGQNGFKLSVFGFDPPADHDALTKQGRGRRVFLPSPERSLLLLKATAQEPHGGGRRIEPGSLRYERLYRWIAEGARLAPAGSDVPERPELVRIEVDPAERSLLAGEGQQLGVWAVDAAGNRSCVTSEAEYESNATPIAGVDPRGYVQAASTAGEAAVLVRYLGHVAVSHITIPRPGIQFPRPPEANFIDRLAWDKLQRLGIEPSGLCDDAMFLRRAFLDVIGTLPTADEARAFLADSASDKRARLVDRLLERPEYADYWTMRFSDLLRVDQLKISPAGALAMTRWLHQQFAENRPYDSLVRELLTARGNLTAEGPAAFYKAMDKPEVLARGISQVFLGVRIECAQCHHHPSDRWGQDDYAAMAGLFTGITHKRMPGGGESLVPVRATDLPHPRTGVKVPAHPLGADPEAFATLDDRRGLLADWMLADANPYFATMIANRLWAHYFGRGLVEPIDDLRTTNPATNPALLAALAAHLRELKYDLKAFTRALLASRLYQLAAETTASNADDEQNFSHAANKPLPAEVLLDAISQATGVPEEFDGWPASYRAIQIWDNKLPLYFFRVFGRPTRASVCECERSNEPSIAQALHLMNSAEVSAKIRARQGRAARLAASDASPRQIADELFLTALGRPPRPTEQAVVLESFSPGATRREAAEDLLWALLNTKEFLYNH